MPATSDWELTETPVGHPAVPVGVPVPASMDTVDIDPAAEHFPTAEQLVADGVVRAEPAAVATALAVLAEGRSQRQAASASGIHRTAVARISAAMAVDAA